MGFLKDVFRNNPIFPTTKELRGVTRLVVVDGEYGRIMDHNNLKIVQSLQDDGRTMKLFIYRKEGK